VVCVCCMSMSAIIIHNDLVRLMLRTVFCGTFYMHLGSDHSVNSDVFCFGRYGEPD
jgi:hypothetical protein